MTRWGGGKKRGGGGGGLKRHRERGMDRPIERHIKGQKETQRGRDKLK